MKTKKAILGLSIFDCNNRETREKILCNLTLLDNKSKISSHKNTKKNKFNCLIWSAKNMMNFLFLNIGAVFKVVNSVLVS